MLPFWSENYDPARRNGDIFQEWLAQRRPRQLPFLAKCGHKLGNLILRTSDRDLPDIIVNHVNEDIAMVEPLSEALRGHGWDVLDNRNLPIGRRLDEYLETVLPEVKCIVTVWSASAVSSPLVRDLAYEAQERGIAVPIITDDTQLPLGHRETRTLDSRRMPADTGDSFGHVLESIEALFTGVSSLAEVTDSPESPSLSLRVARRVVEELRRASDQSVRQPMNADTFYIGEWHIDVGSNMISKTDVTKRVPPRAMEVLVYLAGRAPITVSVEEILDNVWKGRVVVDSAVHRCIRELRIALDDNVQEPQYIETYAKRGYRIVAAISLSTTS